MNKFRIFCYKRGKDFSVDVIVKDGEFHCFGNQNIPPDTTEEVSLLFYKEAKTAVCNKTGEHDGVSEVQ